MDSKTTGVPSIPNSSVPKWEVEDDKDDKKPPKMVVNYDSNSSLDKDSDNDSYDPPVTGMQSLMKRSDDANDTVTVEDVLKDDEVLEDDDDKAGVTPEPLGRG